MNTIIYSLQELCWNPLMLTSFIGCGIYFTIRSGFLQIRHPLLIFRSTFGSLKKETGNNGISPFAALSAALAACMGTGNIIGVASALSLGGPGAVFWMILSAILGEMTCCAENILGIKYRIKNSRNEWLGGSMCYIEAALGKKAAVAFSVFCIGAAFGMGNMTQANAISTALSEQTETVPFAIGIILACLAGIVIFGGVKRIAGVTEKLIPAMSLTVIVALILILIKNRSQLLHAISLIIKNAFSLKSIGAGSTGFTLSQAVRYGVSRGVFSNEAGLGSSPIVHACADVKEPLTQGLWGIAEVFIDTVLMCTLTALALLSGGAWQENSILSPTTMSIKAFESVLGRYSPFFVCVSLCVFAFATIIGWGFYGEKAAEYISGRKGVTAYRGFFLIATVIGACVPLDTVWAISDIFNALMAVPNLTALLRLRKKVFENEETEIIKKKNCP